MPPIPDLPPTHSFQNAKLNPSAPQQSAYYPIPPQFKGEIAYENPNYIPSPPMSSRGPRIKNDPGTATASMSNAPRKDPNPNNIEIKTKFPVARIKRIMQADEEVGKVAQVTPVAVSKALELFMISLVSSSAEIAKEKGQKRVTAQHLKSVVLGNDQFDFLSEIVNKISEAQEGAGGETKKRKGEAKADTDSSEEEKKPKKGRGRKKKSDD